MKVDQLEEKINVRQRETEGFRRWFVNKYFEIILWYEKKDGDLYGFQFCFSRNKNEKAYTWTKDYQSSHKISDSYIEPGYSNMSTAILHGDGGLIPEDIIIKYKEESKNIDEEINRLIVEKMIEYNKKRN